MTQNILAIYRICTIELFAEYDLGNEIQRHILGQFAASGID